ncbi:MAG: PDZ domain-containing protein [Candidatus Cloacimonetes bacterium]|nr:PDZ domain-containing protein [Candidatus Cloacimonadota bacterium]
MKHLIILTVTLFLGTVGLHALMNIENQVLSHYAQVIEYPYHELYEVLFAENKSDQKTEDSGEFIIEKKIIVTENVSDIDMEEIDQKIKEAMKKVEEVTRDLDTGTGSRIVTIELDRQRSDSAYMGVVTEDLTLSQAAEMGYNKFYGVLITSVVPNSPARAQRILPDDIIMEVDGQRISNRRIFTNIIGSYNIGDTVRMKIFRNRQEMDMDFTFGSRHDRIDTGIPGEQVVRKPKISVGSFGGGWIPLWYTPEVDDINKMITSLGFAEIDDKGQFLNGGGAKINVGKGLFLGGMGAGYSFDRRINVPDENVIRRMRYSTGFGGITLEQRIPVTRKLITSVGSMLGWGTTRIEVSQNDGNYNWDDLSTQINDTLNNYLNLYKSYIFLQPKAELYYRLNSWLSIRGEVGYILSYSYHNGWNVDDTGDVYEVKGSPNTSFDGLTISVGPWFGF